MKALIEFKNLTDIDKQLKNESNCRAYYEKVRWGGDVVCPHCESAKVYTLKRSKHQNEYKCANKECYKKFNCLSATIFENTKISLIVWFKAIHLTTTLSKGISSVDLSKTLGVTQKTAWFLNHRIREMLKVNAPELLSGEVEVDLVWIGGKDTNKPVSKRLGVMGNTKDKTPVVGVVERGGGIVLKPIEAETKAEIIPFAVNAIEPNTTIYTDEWKGFKALNKKHAHSSVNHSAGEYVRGKTHTGTIDGAWGLFKRKINGVHHFVSPKHLHRYCNEFAFSYTNRKVKAYDKFNAALSNSNSRLLYKDLIKE